MFYLLWCCWVIGHPFLQLLFTVILCVSSSLISYPERFFQEKPSFLKKDLSPWYPVPLSNTPEPMHCFAFSLNLVNTLITSCILHRSFLRLLQKQKLWDRIPHIRKQLEEWFEFCLCRDAIWWGLFSVIIFIFFMRWWKKEKVHERRSALEWTVQSTTISRQWNGCFQPQNLACLFVLFEGTLTLLHLRYLL